MRGFVRLQLLLALSNPSLEFGPVLAGGGVLERDDLVVDAAQPSHELLDRRLLLLGAVDQEICQRVVAEPIRGANVGEDHVSEFVVEAGRPRFLQLGADALQVALRYVLDALGRRRVDLLAQKSAGGRAGLPLQCGLEHATELELRGEESVLRQEGEVRLGARVAKEGQDIGERALAAALVADDRDQPMVEGQRPLEPLLRGRRVGGTGDRDLREVFGRVLSYVSEGRRTFAQIDASFRLVEELAESVEGCVRANPQVASLVRLEQGCCIVGVRAVDTRLAGLKFFHECLDPVVGLPETEIACPRVS